MTSFKEWMLLYGGKILIGLALLAVGGLFISDACQPAQRPEEPAATITQMPAEKVTPPPVVEQNFTPADANFTPAPPADMTPAAPTATKVE